MCQRHTLTMRLSDTMKVANSDIYLSVNDEIKAPESSLSIGVTHLISESFLNSKYYIENVVPSFPSFS